MESVTKLHLKPNPKLPLPSKSIAPGISKNKRSLPKELSL